MPRLRFTVLLALLFVPAVSLAKTDGVTNHCDACTDIESSLTPTPAWQTTSGTTVGTSNSEYAYSFCAVAGGTYTFSFCQQGGTANYDTGLAIWSISGGACGTPYGCADDQCGALSEISWIAPSDGQYVVKVGGFGGAQGDYTLAYTGTSCTAPPDCSAAVACEPVLWPPNHKFHAVSICGVTDPDSGDVVTITVTSITQDEPTNTRGDGNTCPDAQLVGGQASVRAERTGTPGIPGNGRVYTINFTADDGHGGQCSGAVHVCVPHDQSDATCIDDGLLYNSLGPCGSGSVLTPEAVSLNVGSVSGGQAQISFALPTDTFVDVSVFDVTGRRVATLENGQLPSGGYERVWSMRGVSNGLYFVNMRTGGETLTRTVIKVHQ